MNKKKNLNYTEDLATKIFEVAKSINFAEVKTTSKTYKMVISEQGVDRDGEIVMIAGIDLTYYKQSPVILVDHDYRIEKLVGKSIDIYQEGNKLISEFVFADTELGKLAQKLYDGGFLKASSIGFMVKERQSDNWFIISKSELLERSFVVVGSNRGALSLDGKEFELAKSFGWIKEGEEPQEGAVINNDEAPEGDAPTDEPEPTNKEIMAEMKEIKTLLISLADDKAKKNEGYEVKEALQKANRAVDEACRIFKNSLKK